MFKNLIPRRDIFFDFFDKIAAVAHLAAEELNRSIADGGDPNLIYEKVNTYEHEGDRITHECIELLHKTFITPIDRQDIYRLISKLDDVLDGLKDISKLIVIYKIKDFKKEALEMASILVAATLEVQRAMAEFKKMKINDQIRSHFFNINHLENEADTVHMQALERLFDEERDPIVLIKWKEILNHFEHVIDICEDISNILEGIILENE